LIREIANTLSSSLLANNLWLTQIRILGYLKRISVADGRDSFIVIGNDEQIGLTDIKASSGYIRFRGDIQMAEGKKLNSCSRLDRVTIPLRLVVVAKTDTPENIAWALATQIGATTFSLNSQLVSFIPVQASGDSHKNVLEETGVSQWNAELRVFVVDFIAEFQWQSDCPLPVTYPDMCNCTLTLNLGCFTSCDLIDTGIAQSGVVTMQAPFNGVTQVVTISDGPSEDNIIVDTSVLNEAYTYTVQFFDSDGEVITRTVDGTIYDCFKFEITPKL